MVHHVQIVRNEQIGEVQPLLQVNQQVQHLRLHGFVQRRDRLIQDQHPRIQRDPARDVDPLALPAGHFMRVPIGEHVRLQPHQTQRRPGLLARFVATDAVHAQAEGDFLGRGVARVQRRIAVLEHHLHGAPQFAQRQSAMADRVAIQHHVAGVGIDQPHQQAGGGGLAATGLADDAQGFALSDVEADSVHGLDMRVDVAQRAAQGEILAQSLHGQDRLRRPASVAGVSRYVDARFCDRVHARTSIAVRRLSLSRLKLTDAAKIITPGSTALIGAT